jgi:hypothetical protein
MSCDFVSLVLQATGGGIAAYANTVRSSDVGRFIMIAGMAFQIFSLCIFMALWLEFMLRYSRSSEDQRDARFAELRESSRFKAFKHGKKPFGPAAMTVLLILEGTSALVRYDLHLRALCLSRIRAERRLRRRIGEQ